MHKGVLMRLFILSFIIFFSSTSIAQENVCPVSDNESLDKLKESDFSKESLEKTLGDLQKLFDGKIDVADEFIWQSQLKIEGAYYRMEVDKWKDDPTKYKYSVERFCNFMKERAYYVH